MKPMVFGTIKNQMEAKDGNWYKNVREIYANVRLVFTNAMKYNDDQSDVHVMAKSLLENFEEKWLQLLAEVAEEEARQKNEEAQTLANMRNSRKAAYSKIARETYNELDELNSQLEELRAMVIKKCSVSPAVSISSQLHVSTHQQACCEQESFASSDFHHPPLVISYQPCFPTTQQLRHEQGSIASSLGNWVHRHLPLKERLQGISFLTVSEKPLKKMTTEEKRKLGVGLSTLSSEDLNKALEIIAEDNPSFQATDEVVDLDLDAQSESTLWKLKFFVKRALENQGKNSARKADDNLKRKREIICEALVKSAAKKRNKKLLVS
ncbi:hypothetical protein ZIOFF_041655 [Zingiber officinale]|uniref:Uncharacterized protein n=1 Tax=Zingiber officinale TaxID=94328 RepID=A0A8J5G7X4_ZINOF|nr:hypothetical protein ZIOFF_041655 [Zingiber officinale]